MNLYTVKKHLLAIASVMLVFAQLVVFTSCEFDESKNNYRGGEMIDAEKMSEIKNELLDTDHPGENETASHSTTESESEGTQKDTEGTERNETESIEIEGGTAIIVYWTEGGSVWHVSRDCYHIKNKDVISGTVEEAEKTGHDKACKTCNKKSS